MQSASRDGQAINLYMKTTDSQVLEDSKAGPGCLVDLMPNYDFDSATDEARHRALAMCSFNHIIRSQRFGSLGEGLVEVSGIPDGGRHHDFGGCPGFLVRVTEITAE